MDAQARQRLVTTEQIRHKRHEARSRALEATRKCSEAKTAAEYNEALRNGVKAARDYEIWHKVFLALTQ